MLRDLQTCKATTQTRESRTVAAMNLGTLDVADEERQLESGEQT